MGRFVIVAYAPKPGREADLMAAVQKHLHVLRSEDLITDRQGYVMRAGNGTIIEVFEWCSTQAIDAAHSNPAVQELWRAFGAACDYIPLTRLAECQQPFAEFDAVEM